jgi:hypothetical protein
VEGGFAFELLEKSAALEFEGALFDRARENDLQFGIVQRVKEKFVGTGLAGFEGNGAAVGLSESDDDDVVANFAHFGEDVEAVGGAVADAIEIEKDRVEIGEFECGFDLVGGGSERGAELCQVLGLRGKLVIVW